MFTKRGAAEDAAKVAAGELLPCGTDAAYQRHVRRGQTPVKDFCMPCAEAHRVVVNDVSDENVALRRLRNKARERALTALRLRHLDEFRILHEKAVRELEEEMNE